MAEKRKLTYDLEALKAAFASMDMLHVTGTALHSAAEPGFGRREIVATLQTTRRSHFFTSMTA